MSSLQEGQLGQVTKQTQRMSGVSPWCTFPGYVLGRGRLAVREMVLMNASAALYVAGKAISLALSHGASASGMEGAKLQGGHRSCEGPSFGFGIGHDRNQKDLLGKLSQTTQAALENGAAVKTLDAYVGGIQRLVCNVQV